MCHRGRVHETGQSPFRVRGSTYVGMRDYAKAHVPGGMAAVAKAMPDGPHRAFVQQIFMAVGWYDALPIRPITEVIARLEGRSWEDSVRTRAQVVAIRDLTVIHRLLLATASPERVAEKLQRAALQYFDFGETTVVEASAGRSKFVLAGVPQPLGSLVFGHARRLRRHPDRPGRRQVADGRRAADPARSSARDRAWSTSTST